jgi:hypothetical protein
MINDLFRKFKSDSVVDYIGAVFIFVTFFIGVFSYFYFSGIKEKSNLETITPSPVTCPSDLKSYSDTTKKLSLIENMPSNGTNKILKGYKVSIERSGLTSDIACGYLVYQVSYNEKPIIQKFMALSMKTSGGMFGGHIIPDEKKGAIIIETENMTQVLIPLDDITYDGISRNPIKEANWVSLLNVAQQIEFEVALSTDQVNGKINLVQIAYKCINKDTGKETEDCNLKLINTSPFGF